MAKKAIKAVEEIEVKVPVEPGFFIEPTLGVTETETIVSSTFYIDSTQPTKTEFKQNLINDGHDEDFAELLTSRLYESLENEGHSL